MRFPLSLTRSLTGYLLRKKLAGETKFPLVLMLEPLHACNLSCAGCGRIREYADTIQSKLSVDECLAAGDAGGARAVGREGVFQAATRGIRAAKRAGFRVCTNTTVYRDTNVHEIAVLFGYLS